MEAGLQLVECEARIRMHFEDSSTAEIVIRALQPDNEPLPRGIGLSARMSGCEVVFEVKSRRPIISLLATLDDILASTMLALKAVQLVGPL
jgi:hypothetical protein